MGKAVRQHEVADARFEVRTTFEVIEVLNGTLGSTARTVDVQASSAVGGGCGVRFEVGETYVVHTAGDPTKGLTTGGCTNTHRVRDVDKDEDVVFARAKPTRAKARVTGLVYAANDRSSPVAGAEVRAKGTQVATKTNARGEFAFDIAPGTYELEVIAKGMRVLGGKVVELGVPTAKACPRAQIVLAWDGQIQGRLTYADGAPASGARLAAIAVPGTQRSSRVEAQTDADGRYTLHEVQAGRWSVVVSAPEDGHPSPASPHPTTYYPGTSDAKKAKPVAMARGGAVSGIDFIVPPAQQVVAFAGAIQRANGRPAAHAFVGVFATNARRSTGASADDKGRVSVRELVGSVVVHACDENDARNCADLELKVQPGMKPFTLRLPK